MAHHSRLRLIVATAVLATAASFPQTNAAPFDGEPKLLLHLGAATSRNQCSAGWLPDCRDAVTEGELAIPNDPEGRGPYYFAYLLAAPGDLNYLNGVMVGLDYETGNEGDQYNGREVDVFGWTLCADLEFLKPRPNQWPEPNSGAIITWDSCQGYESVVAGYFYVAAYSPGTLRLTEHPFYQRAAVSNCCNREVDLGEAGLGSVRFSSGRAEPGCNPCEQSCPGEETPDYTLEPCSIQPPPPRAPSTQPAAIILHLSSPVAKNTCLNGLLADPADAVVTADLVPGTIGKYFIYLLAAREREMNIAGVQCGISYGGEVNHGVEVLQWAKCATLEWPTPGTEQWPESGGGNLLTWLTCQSYTTTVAGYFYVSVYSDDVFRVTPRPIDGKAKVALCSAAEIEIGNDRLGQVAFSTGGVLKGCNPWLESCAAVPVETTTWGRIKTVFGR